VRAARRDARLVDADPIDLASTAARLPSGSALVLYHVAGERLHAIAVTRERSRGVDLGPWRPVADAVAGYLRLASTPDGPEAALARRLHAALLAPLASDLATSSRLVVVPDGALAFLPFEALLDASERPKRLVETVEVVYAPAATAYDLLRGGTARRGRGLLALGDPTFPAETAALPPRPLALLRGAGSLPRLPASGDEVRGIASLFPAEERTVLLRDAATLEGLTHALASRREPLAALHLACHGLLDAEHPALSGLALSGGTLWTANDVARARIPADLAVLSACETAGGVLAAGEGVMGLVRSFFYAGVPRVVVSDWAVSDAGTAAFMRRTYEGIVRQGLSPSAALAAAKREAIAAGGASAHPSRWAPFVLWGLAE
jgi:CHAT domain-containing protein